METIPYPFNELTKPELDYLRVNGWGNLVVKNSASMPKRMPEGSVYYYGRGPEKLTIHTWRAQKESPSGGYTVSAHAAYQGRRFVSTKARAGGGNYCKESAAVADALGKLGEPFYCLQRLHGCGMNTIEKALEYLGFRRV